MVEFCDWYQNWDGDWNGTAEEAVYILLKLLGSIVKQMGRTGEKLAETMLYIGVLRDGGVTGEWLVTAQVDPIKQIEQGTEKGNNQM